MKKSLFVLFFIIFLGFLIPQQLQMPVVGASNADYHPKSFWYYPWGRSVTHKGVDIFAQKGTPIKSATNGIVISTGNLSVGGNYVLILGPKWRLHYYAHLNDIKTDKFSIVSKKNIIGTVGNSGNAKGKAPHLHYAIFTPFPYFWKLDLKAKQGWKKMFYLNPIQYFKA